MIWEKSRRIGATYADNYKACRDRNLCDERRDFWFSSADESAALEYALYCRQWCELMEIVIKETTEELEDEKGYKYNNYVIEFPNGSRANCLTSNPRRFRSKGGDVVLDEFAWHDKPGEMLDAALPTTTWGYTIRILSTHNGEGSVFNKIVELCKRVAKGELTDWGDDWWINMGRVPARYTLEAGLEGLTGPSLPEGEPQGEEQPKAASNSDIRDTTYEIRATSDEARRLRIWRNWVISWSGIEKEYQNALRTFFVRQQRILTKKLRDALAESENLRASKAPSDDVICRIVFDLKIEDGKIKVINQTFFGKASELGIRQSLTEILGLKGDELAGLTEQVKVRPRLKRSLWISSRKITGVNAITRKMVASQLRTGLEAGEGLKELTARLKSTLGSNRARAQSIARTQTAGGVGTGRHEGFRAAAVELKTWLTSRDGNVRESHSKAEARYAKGIPLDSYFVLDLGNVMYPGDPSGPAGEIINCRCVELAKRAAGKAFDLGRYAALQFYSYSDMQIDIYKSEDNTHGQKS